MDFRPLYQPLYVFLGDNSQLSAIGIGTVLICLINGMEIYVPEVYLVPQLCKSLLSVAVATSNGASISFCGTHCTIHTIYQGQQMTLNFPQIRGLYPLRHGIFSIHGAVVSIPPSIGHLWHCRLGHLLALCASPVYIQ